MLPTRTRHDFGFFTGNDAWQCFPVSTNWGAISAPPHNGKPNFPNGIHIDAAIHGNCPGFAFVPFTMPTEPAAGESACATGGVTLCVVVEHPASITTAPINGIVHRAKQFIGTP